MYKSKPEFKRLPQAEQVYDIEYTFEVGSRKNNRRDEY